MSFLNTEGLERLWQHIVLKLGNKVDKIDGKGLSTNDFTTEEKGKLAELSTLVGDTSVSTQISNAISEIDYPVDSVNGKTGAVVLAASDIGAVPTTRTVNGKALSSNITLSASDVGAAASSHGNHVPTTETADNAKFLRNDNTWATVTPANIGAAATDHGTHVTYATDAPKAAGTAAVGTSSKVAREDHVHPLQTTISGNAATATKATQDASGNVITDTYATKTELSVVSDLVGDEAVSTQITNAIADKSDSNHTHDDRYYTESEIDSKLSGKSDTSHAHSATDITSGVLSTEYGGTGNATGRITTGLRSGQTLGDYATAEGVINIASGQASHAEGYSTSAFGDGSHAEGYGTVNGKSVAYGRGSHVEGVNTTAGASTIAADSSCAAHAEGFNTVASATYSHAEGYQTDATASAAHAEGSNTTASGNSAHAEGANTTASGSYSHAEGSLSEASAMASHAEGYHTAATSLAQHAQGRYNVLDTQGGSGSIGKYVHIVGNGTSDTERSNAHTLDWDGNAWFAGDVYVGGTDQASGEKLAKVSELPTETVVDATLANSGQAADAKATGDAISSLNTLVGDTPVADQISAAINAKIYVQSTIPEDAPIGAIWIDTATTAITSAEGVAF